MSDMRKLIESMDRIANPLQKDGDQWQGNDSGTPGNKLVGDSCEESDKFLGAPYIREGTDEPLQQGDIVQISKRYGRPGYYKVDIEDAIGAKAEHPWVGDLIDGSGFYIPAEDLYVVVSAGEFNTDAFGSDEDVDDYLNGDYGDDEENDPHGEMNESVEEIAEQLKKAFEDFVGSKEDYNTAPEYFKKKEASKPSVNRPKPKLAKVVDPRMVKEETNTAEMARLQKQLKAETDPDRKEAIKLNIRKLEGEIKKRKEMKESGASQHAKEVARKREEYSREQDAKQVERDKTERYHSGVGVVQKGKVDENNPNAEHEIEWTKNKIASLPANKVKQKKDLERQNRHAEIGIALRPKNDLRKDKIKETKSLEKKVRIVAGSDKGKVGTIRQIKHGLFKGAPKKYDVDLEDGGQANGLPATALRLVKDVAESKTASRARGILQRKLDDIEKRKAPAPELFPGTKEKLANLGKTKTNDIEDWDLDRRDKDELNDPRWNWTLDENSPESRVMPLALQLHDFVVHGDKDSAGQLLAMLRTEGFPSETVHKICDMAKNMSSQQKTRLNALRTDQHEFEDIEVDEDLTQQVMPAGQQVQQPGTQPQVAGQAQPAPTTQPVTQPKTTAQQPPAPAGTPTAVATNGAPQPPAAGQAGGAPIAPKPGTPVAPTGTAANAATTPLQSAQTFVTQMANDPAAAKQVATKLGNVK